MNDIPLVVHVLPYDGVGGVEVAARSVEDGAYLAFAFQKHYLFDSARPSLAAYAAAVRGLLVKRPAVVVASLWRSYAVAIALKLIRPSQRVVTFLHYPRSVHAVDWLLTRLALACSDEIWADSIATREERVPTSLRSRCKVVSMLTEHMPPPPTRQAAPRFIFWGRLHKQKGLDRALELFAEVRDAHPEATFDIIGPDHGVQRQLMTQAAAIGGVTFHGPLPKDRIFDLAMSASFYLQPSRNEGAAMSVMEAMQLGLVPVVTPVGDMKNYCNASNAVIAASHMEALLGIARLLVRPAEYRAAAESAYRTWRDRSLYREDVVANCERLSHG